MTIGEIRTRKVIVAPRATSIYEAAKLMREHHTGDVVVTDEFDGGKIPVGIVTDRDMVLEILAENLDPALLSVGEIMTENPVCARENDGIFETIQLMRSEGVRRVPIVDARGALTGIVTLDDIIEVAAGELGEMTGLLRQERRREIEARR